MNRGSVTAEWAVNAVPVTARDTVPALVGLAEVLVAPLPAGSQLVAAWRADDAGSEMVATAGASAALYALAQRALGESPGGATSVVLVDAWDEDGMRCALVVEPAEPLAPRAAAAWATLARRTLAA